jgi:3-deoxy-manno-octulosonate cytidylyltransferase (CMP-KDO synthetase)
MQVHGIIPARFASTRFPGKPLAKIQGQPLLSWVIRGAQKSRKIQTIKVATDDERIAKLAQELGVEAVMTSTTLATGTDRVWAAVQGSQADVVVNIQGDEPLVDANQLDSLASVFEKDPSIQMATLGKVMTPEALESTTTAKIVVNLRDEALYFSRFPIPYSREKAYEGGLTACLKHIGLYAFRKDFLREFCAQSPVEIEKYEGLEQLRALYLGAKIKVVRVDGDSWGVDTPDDIKRIEKLMKDNSPTWQN